MLNITNKISNRALIYIYNDKEPINLIWYSEFHASIRKQSSANLIIQQGGVGETAKREL